MSKELEHILDFADVLVKSSLLNSNDKERLAQWREDREKLYTALERKEKLEKFTKLVISNGVDLGFKDWLLTLKDYNAFKKEATGFIEKELSFRPLTEEDFNLIKEILEEK